MKQGEKKSEIYFHKTKLIDDGIMPISSNDSLFDSIEFLSNTRDHDVVSTRSRSLAPSSSITAKTRLSIMESHLFSTTTTTTTTPFQSYLNNGFAILYLLATIISLVGNSLILIVLLRRKRMRRTVTNFFLANITLANLLYTICAPIKFFMHVHNLRLDFLGGHAPCNLLPFLSAVSINVNTFSMVAASIERFIFIVFPFMESMNKRKSGFIILSIWIISVLVSMPWFFILKSEHYLNK